MNEFIIGDCYLSLPDNWSYFADEDVNLPHIFQKTGGVGELQLVIALRITPLSNPYTPEQMLQDVHAFAERSRFVLSEACVEEHSYLLVTGSMHNEATYLGTWELADNADFACFSYFCKLGHDDRARFSEVADCEKIARSFRFRAIGT